MLLHLSACDAGKPAAPKLAPESEPPITTTETEKPGVSIPAGGEMLFEAGFEVHQLNKGPEERNASFERVSGAGTGFEHAIRGRVIEVPEMVWHAQISTPVKSDLPDGAIVLLSFWARTVETEADSGMGEFLVYLGMPATDGVEPSVNQREKVGPRWKQFLIPARVLTDYRKDLTHLNLDFGSGRQTIEFAGIQLHRYEGKEIGDLPVSE